MPSIRKTKTGSGATAVQVVRYAQRKVVILKHCGSGKTEDEIAALIAHGEEWIARGMPQQSLFVPSEKETVSLASLQHLGTTHRFARDILLAALARCGFDTLHDPLLCDLALMRLIEPASKLRTITLFNRYFAIAYSERTVYRALHEMAKRKGDAEKIAVAFAKEKLSSDLALVLYDVTTLYFETFETDELRVPGFSKDNKSQQPQIVVGLLVTREGFPLGYEVFKGNTFEGHTMLPVLEQFATTHGVTTPTVVADAAMISRENVAKLKEKGLSYIVGARLANAPPRIIEKISATLEAKDGAMTRISTDHGDLVCDFSAKRYRKDKHEAEKQIGKAKALVEKGEPGKRAKFVMKEDDKETYVLNDALVAKATLLFGVKGYYTNIPEGTLSDNEVIARYHDLWNVEASFRMAKHDLATRPIFHRKEEAIRAHMVVCFVALALGKSIELSTGLSIRRFIDGLWNVTDARIVDTATGKEFLLRSPVDNAMKGMLKTLGVSY